MSRNIISKLARERGKEESDFLAELLDLCGHEQKAIAERLHVSQAAISVALKRNKFRPVIKWVKEQIA